MSSRSAITVARLMCFVFAFTLEVHVQASEARDPHVAHGKEEASNGEAASHAADVHGSHAESHDGHKADSDRVHEEHSFHDAETAKHKSSVPLKSRSNTARLLQEPANCLKAASGPCAIRTSADAGFDLALGENVIVIDRSTSVARVSENEIVLMSGQVWVKAKSGFTVKSEYGSAILSAGGEAWVSRRKRDRFAVSAISNVTLLKARGSNVDLEVRPGLENWLGAVTSEGSAETGIPIAIDFKSHLERWARLYPGAKQDFEREVRIFHGQWSEAKVQAASVHKELFDRKIASIENERQRQRELKQRKERKDRQYQDMFRERFFSY